MKRILLGLGSNMNYHDKSSIEILECACHDLAHLLKNAKYSSVYITKAMYVTNQQDFYNMAVLGYLPEDYDASKFLIKIHEIEQKYGRDRLKEIRFGPRSLDIDIELFGNDIIDLPDLQIPHIRIEERAFVLIPSLEILRKYADCKIRAKYKKCLSKLKKEGKADDVKFFVSAKSLKIGSGGVKYGSKY